MLEAESYFSTLPSVDIPRSRYKVPFQHKTTFNTGDLVPIFLEQNILPGETVSLDLSSLVRMSTPIFPVFDNAFLDVYFFFCPYRLLWDHFREFMGENSSGYWAQPTEYTTPFINVDTKPFVKGDLADYLGLPTEVENIHVSHLPFRAYSLIWNEWFRDQNTMPPAYFTKGDADTLKTVSRYDLQPYRGTFSERLQNVLQGVTLLPVSRYHDYFSSCLPAPQKGEPVMLPIDMSNIPVHTRRYSHNLSDEPLTFDSMSYLDPSSDYNLMVSTTNEGFTLYGSPSGSPVGDGSSSLMPNNLYVSNEYMANISINEIRTAFQIQRLLEKDARGGTRYRELIKMHFGVDNQDARMQVPEYLGGKRIPINVDQVLQTSGTTDVSPQGNTGAYSMTSDVSSLFTKSFTEHGLIMGLVAVRTEHTYQQGIERAWSRRTRFDYYWPALAHISEQPVYVKEIFAQGTEADNNVFGYQEAFADYRYKPSYVSGAFRSNYAQTLDSWHYADYYDPAYGNADFVLSPEWLEETPVNVERTLAVSTELEDQFLGDFYFDLTYVSPMPLHGTPGLVDHY